MRENTAGAHPPARRRRELRLDNSHTSPPVAGTAADPPDRDSGFAGDVPLIVEHGLYSREQILRLVGISRATLSDWQDSGLRFLKKGTKRLYYHGRDVIDFLKREN